MKILALLLFAACTESAAPSPDAGNLPDNCAAFVATLTPRTGTCTVRFPDGTHLASGGTATPVADRPLYATVDMVWGYSDTSGNGVAVWRDSYQQCFWDLCVQL